MSEVIEKESVVNSNENLRVLLKHLHPEMDDDNQILLSFQHGVVEYIGEDKKSEARVAFILASHPARNVIYVTKVEDLQDVINRFDKGDYGFLEEKTTDEVMLQNQLPYLLTLFPIDMPEVWLDFGYNKASAKEKELYKFVVEAMNIKVFDLVSKTIVIAEELKKIVTVKDHDLYLAFKATDSFTKMNVTLEKVSHRLPEGGDVNLGDAILDPEDWKCHGDRAYVVAKRVRNSMKAINREIEHGFNNLAKTGLRPGFKSWFLTDLANMLMATSHYLTEIYNFNLASGGVYVDEVSNEIQHMLACHGGSIGLDLNSWIVWDYSDSTQPPVRVEALNIADMLHGSYTESFVQALYDRMIHVQSEHLRPYFHKEVVDADDGVKLGEIRRVH